MHRVRTIVELSDGRDLVRAVESAEGSWSEADVRDWERARDDAWARWPSDRS
jgi:hypothetical protein